MRSFCSNLLRAHTGVTVALVLAFAPAIALAGDEDEGMTFDAEAVDDMVDDAVAAVPDTCDDEQLEKLRREFEKTKKATLLRSIAQCYEGMDQLGSAMSYYQNYLRVAKDAEDAGAIEAKIEELKRKREEAAGAAGKGWLKVNVNVFGAKILVDGEKVGTSPMKKKIPLPAALYEVGALAAGYPEFLGTATVHDRETTTIDIELEKPKKFPVAAVVVGVVGAVAVGVVIGVLVAVSKGLPTPTLTPRFEFAL